MMGLPDPLKPSWKDCVKALSPMFQRLKGTTEKEKKALVKDYGPMYEASFYLNVLPGLADKLKEEMSEKDDTLDKPPAKKSRRRPRSGSRDERKSPRRHARRK